MTVGRATWSIDVEVWLYVPVQTEHISEYTALKNQTTFELKK